MSEYASLQKERTKKVNRLHAVFEHSGFTNIKRSDLRTSNARNKNIMLLSENDRNEARRILQIAQSVSGVGKIVSLCFSAVVAIARKLAELIYTLIKNKTLYEPRPYKKQNTNALDKTATEALQSSVA